MAVFILSTDGRDEDVVEAFRSYESYLRSHRANFPPSAYALATSDWYFGNSDHRAPHDAWLESAEFTEPSAGQGRENRQLSLTVRLLGAYQDGFIELHYPQVFAYTLDMQDSAAGHRDWRYDELRLSENGHLIHEIEWHYAGPTGRWLIEATDVTHRWIPF
jgi:hypothetical protein